VRHRLPAAASLLITLGLLGGCSDDGSAPPFWDGAADLERPDFLRPDLQPPLVDGPLVDGAVDSVASVDGPGAPLFDDVPAGHLYYVEIQWVGHKGYMVGCSASPAKFCPVDSMKRSDMAVATARMKFGESFSYTPTPHFSDVPAGHPAFKYIQKLHDANIVLGCSVGKYCPDQTATRADAAAIIVRAKFGQSFNYSTMPAFSDVPATHAAFKYVQKLYDAQISLGCGSGNYCPGDDLLRQHMAVFLYRAQTL